MSESPTIVQTGPQPSLAKERLLWATRPVGFLLLVLWVLHPVSAQGGDLIHLALVGFLVGLFYGLVVYGKNLQNYIFRNKENDRFIPNRIPEEYFWGNIEKTLSKNS